MKKKSILYLVVITLTTITIKTQSRSLLQSSSSCSSSCGNIPEISFPFRLKGDPAACGDPDYELSCENNETTLSLYSGKYMVKKISYNKHIIRLVDVNFSNGTCSLPSGSLSRDQIDRVDFRYRGWPVFRSYTSFVRCSEEVTELGFLTVPCESRNGSYVYVQFGSGFGGIVDLPKSCELISVAPVDILVVKNNHTYGDIVNALESGFDLGWSVECRDCLESGDSCSISSFEDPVLYECSNNHIATLVVAVIWILLLAIHLIARFILVPIFLIGFFIYKCRTKRKSSGTMENVQQG